MHFLMKFQMVRAVKALGAGAALEGLDTKMNQFMSPASCRLAELSIAKLAPYSCSILFRFMIIFGVVSSYRQENKK